MENLINKETDSEIGYLILLRETLNRNENKMIQYYKEGDKPGMKALINMQMRDCGDIRQQLRKLIFLLNKSDA